MTPRPIGAEDFQKPDRLILPDELSSWIVEEDEEFICFNKPGWVVCHPSKHGPWSSLVGAVGAHRGWESVHLVSRLDRETSGVNLIAKTPVAASKAQTAMENRWVTKTYLTILVGELPEPVLVDEPMGPDKSGLVKVKQYQGRREGFQTAVTFFEPLAHGGGYTLARVSPHTGRKHQIRVHAQGLGYPVAGDKLYGPDETLYLDFTETGWSERHERALPIARQALHAARLEFKGPRLNRTFWAPLTPELRVFMLTRMGLSEETVDRAEALIDP